MCIRDSNRGQRRTDIVGDRAEQVCTHFFLFAFHTKTVLLLDLGCHRAGDERDAQHGQKGERVAGKRKIKFPVRIGENVVDANHAQQGCERTEQITVGEPGDQQYGKHEYRKSKTIAAVRHAKQGAYPDLSLIHISVLLPRILCESDASEQWAAYRMTLPGGRTSAVAGRFLLALACNAVLALACAAGMLVCCLVLGTMHAMPRYGAILLLCEAWALGFSGIMLAVSYRWNIDKANYIVNGLIALGWVGVAAGSRIERIHTCLLYTSRCV